MNERAPLILLVGADATITYYRAGLEACGLRVESVASAEAALDSLDHALPAMLVTDFTLPGMTACQLARHLRLNRATRALPVIALVQDISVMRDAMVAGVDAVVEKWCQPSFLAIRISALLRGPHSPTHAVLRERFRRPTVAVAISSGSTLPVLDVLRGEGLDVLMLDHAALTTPDFWFPGIDCLIVDLSCTDFDGLAFCRTLDRLRRRAFSASQTPARLLGFDTNQTVSAMEAYTGGMDDFLTDIHDADLFLLHVRVQLRRKSLLDESVRSEAERAARDAAMEGARAKTVLADALEQANDELASANRKLIDAQTKLVQSAKMASLGELVAGIAHEFNNPLAFVLAHGATVSRLLDRALVALETGDTVEVRMALEKSRDRLASTAIGLGRMRDLVSSLRRFSRLDQGAFEDVDMPDAINTVLALLAPKLADRVKVELDFQAPPLLRCQMALVHQVVMNVVSNAADALHAQPADEGRSPMILIGTHLEETSRETEAFFAHDYVITICDNGPGVEPLMRERVFEPFFTTKPVGEGTGLGLATAYGIVQAHGGTIEVSSSGTGGACFTISVPAEPPVVGKESGMMRASVPTAALLEGDLL
ncbi:ATP-binding protein [Acetobacter conturbans]|uniref:histidine kinase n=1 Tax=Acetobacter conturbans TaxID=1737472 RepID=A0ABX0K3Q2_9PROT|nr:ATP-binding protein [Acetobacter conturbans]NHN88074.1 response regulator [Acetobacter conturbans]